MAAPPFDLMRDEPEAYIARDRRWALSRHEEMPDRVQGAALFADISGFTPLTEALADELGSQRGAEELTAHLGRVFHAIIEELDRRGGDVIYFSGDAITCWLDDDDGSRATAAALAMQAAIARVGRITTPGGRDVRLALKVAVAVGPARRFLVGDPEIQLIDVLAGSLIDDLAEAEHHAEQGEVVLDTSAMAALGDRVRVRETRRDESTGRVAGVVDALLVDVPTVEVAEPPPLDEALVRPWLLPPVYERLREGRGELLAELRPAYPVFLRFGGIDYDDDPEAVAKLDDFVRQAQRIMAGFGGNVLQLTLGDKGAYLYGVFGSPIAHEDDAARAAAAALELRDLERTTEAIDIQVGLTRGRLRSGTYGHAMRRTFVCLGDAVNLAARLMSKAPPGAIYVDDRVRTDAGEAYIWERLPDLQVKGKKGVIVAHALKGSLERASRRKTRFELPLIGRSTELARLETALDLTLAGDGRILGIAAEAGMGKSRLVAEFVRSARRRGLFVAFGECQSFGTTTSYFVWREVWRRLLGIEEDESTSVQVTRISDLLASIDPGLVSRAPLLSAVLGIDIPDSELTAGLDAKVRKASLEDLLATCLRERSAREPLVLVLEDCHWIDALSQELLVVLGRATAALPVLIVLAYRPASEPGGGLGVERIPDFEEVVLAELAGDDASALIRSKLEQVLGTASAAEAADPSEALIGLVTQRSGGNPFYIEELISYITGRGVDLVDGDAIAELELPESLHSLVLSRIDQMPESPRRTLKVASVVGRVFEAPLLPGAYPELGGLDDVVENLDALRAADLVLLDREADQAYLFKHVATQEVAYESLPFGIRTMLHGRIGTYIEETDPDGIEHRLDLLAHHFWMSDDEGRKRHYLARASDAARAAYANEAAIRYLERLVPLLDGAERVDRSLELADVLHLIGAIPVAETVVTEARGIATELGDVGREARCDHSLAEAARRVGRFTEAEMLLERAQVAFLSVGDEGGQGDVLQVRGTIRAQRGDAVGARERYLESLAIRERLQDDSGVAALCNNLGIATQQAGDPVAARRYAERALDLYGRLGDRRRIGTCLVNLAWMDGMTGDHDGERRRSEEAIRLFREVGDRLNLAIAQNNLGDALRELDRFGDAGDAYAAAMGTYRDLNDLGPMMALFEDVAMLASRRGDHVAAFILVGAADRLRQALESPRSVAAARSLMRRLSPSRDALGDGPARSARRRGARLPVDVAIEQAIRAAHSAPIAA
jgi:class 3 adenylate cyclase/tetratricopeptide (TPR) repeat protein